MIAYCAHICISGMSDMTCFPSVSLVSTLHCSQALKSCHLLAGSACKAVKAVLESSSAEVTASSDAPVPQQAALKALLQQCVMVLSMAPEDLFEGLVERLEARISAKYEGKLQAATKEAVLAQASLRKNEFLQLNMLQT